MNSYSLKNKNLKVSVIIPTYNCARYISKAIDSVLKQTYRDFEIIIINDGSSDDTEKVVKPYLKNESVSYIYQENKGVAAARNKGIRNSKGEYIALLDADDYWSSMKLEKQIPIFEKMHEVKLVHSNMYIFNEGDEGNFEKYSMDINYNKLTQKQLFEKILFWQADILSPTVIIKKDLLEEK